MANVITLLSRIQGGRQGSEQSNNSVPDIEGEHLWLEAFLDRWVSAEDEFFAIALEKEERDALSKARALHLVSEGDTIPMTSLKGYRRPSVIRKATEDARARIVGERLERTELRNQRKLLGHSLAKSRHLVQSLSVKLANLTRKLNDYEQKLIESSKMYDELLDGSTRLVLEASEALSSEFSTMPEYSTLLQTIARSFGEKYRLVQAISKEWSDPEDLKLEIDREFWILCQAFRKLEDEVSTQEVEGIIAQLNSGSTWIEITGDFPTTSSPPATTEVMRQLESAWRKDESNKLLRREHIILKTNELLTVQMLPPLTLFYAGLARLQSHVTNVHALCKVLVLELHTFASRLQELQADLDENDELLIRLSALFQLDTNDQDELSASSVLERLKSLSGSSTVRA